MTPTMQKTILKALATHKRKHQVLYLRANGRIGRTKYYSNIERLKTYHINEVNCVDLVVEKLMEELNLKRRKKSNFLTEEQRNEIQQLLLAKRLSMKNIAIKYQVSYETVSRIKRKLK